jgi:hypothetical protein
MDAVLRAIFGSDGSSPVMIDLGDSIQPNQKFEVNLTEHQRESLIKFCNLGNRLRKKLETAGPGKQVVSVSRKELDELNDKIGSTARDAPAAHRKRLMAVQAQVAELFAQDHHENLVRHNQKAARRSNTTWAPTKNKKPTKTIYQFKITLLDSKPKIWRRIQIPDCKLNTLHYHIQAVMGWNNSHLHHFEIKGERYGIPKHLDYDGDGSIIDSKKILLSDLLANAGKKFAFEYTYDMGDNWEHEVLFEGVVKADPKTKYPVCVEGERACPPEDCGGVPGYEHLLEVLRDPSQEEYPDALHWVGEDFDPERFDVQLATVRMVRELKGRQ